MGDQGALRLIILGGFLGAGKTTAMTRLARHYQGCGLRVGLVTNDQAENLVDTTSLRAQGFAVEEVAGACFCCRFDQLVDRVEQLQEHQRPDVILAEPVGSCTDLVATVVQPLKALCGERFRVAPFCVLLKPSHGLRILRGAGQGGFSPKAAYIFHKQLEEADAILINRVDQLTATEADELEALVARQFPEPAVLRVAARSGQGFDELVALLESDGDFGRRILEIDYDVYAEGEAELGWLNGSARLAADKPWPLDEMLLEVVGKLRESLATHGAEVAHLKVIGLGEQSFGVANLVSSASEPELSLASRDTVHAAELVINARVAADPAMLAVEARRAVTDVCRARGIAAEFTSMRHLRPGRPTPTHRFAAADR